MLKKFKNFKQGDEGFSLIELVVAVGIMLVLAAAVMFGYPGFKDWQNNAKIQMAAATAYESGINSITNPWGDLSLEDMRAYVEGEYEDVIIDYVGTTTDDFCVGARFDWDYDYDFMTFRGACDTWIPEGMPVNPRTGDNCSLFSCDRNDGNEPIITEPEPEEDLEPVDYTGIISTFTFQCDADSTYKLPLYGVLEGTVIELSGSDGSFEEVSFEPLEDGDPIYGEVYRTGSTSDATMLAGVTYTLTVEGKFGLLGGYSDHTECLTHINNIHEDSGVEWIGFTGAGVPKLVDVPDSIPSTVNSLSYVFNRAAVFNDPDVINWDVSNVSSMAAAFRDAVSFNQDISGWNTSSGGYWRSMFAGATSFNQDIGGWDTSSVHDMGNMFEGATGFNQDLTEWNVSNVSNYNYFATGATNFDQSNWPNRFR